MVGEYLPRTCGVCGGRRFSRKEVLWPELIDEWQLSPAEADYINRQQGECCDACGSNLRSIALANALRAFLQTSAPLRAAMVSPPARDMAILEVNEAGNLSPVLRTAARYRFGAYPEVDLHALPFAEQSFDLVVHSDTLEHVANPVHALGECRRVLKPDGALCFTVPMVVGRLSRNRSGLAKSFHGNPETTGEDFMVHTEFGADAWTCLMEAGFTDVSIHSFGHPAAHAFLARNGWAVR